MTNRNIILLVVGLVAGGIILCFLISFVLVFGAFMLYLGLASSVTNQITVTAGPGGKIVGESGAYHNGEKPVFTAVPDSGYFFVGWSDGEDVNPRTILSFDEIGDVDIQASFSLKPIEREKIIPFSSDSVDLMEINDVDLDLIKSRTKIKFVNFGLPSKTLWATCNLGASSPEQAGVFSPWDENNINNAVSSVFGKKSKVPSMDQWIELISECCWVWTGNYAGTSVCGFIVYKPKNKEDVCRWNGKPVASYSIKDVHIFLPAAGYGYQSHFYRYGDIGYYWSSEAKDNESVYNLQIDYHKPECEIMPYYKSLPIRVVRKQ